MSFSTLFAFAHNPNTSEMKQTAFTDTTGQIPHLNAYSEYCANYASALICLNKKAERERMAQFLEKTAPLGQHAKLPDYLILPVQRVPVCVLTQHKVRKHY